MPARTRRERLEERERSILEAAGEVFAERGFGGATMADIARRAAVAEGTVYLYFRNKDALLEALIARFYAELTEGAREGVQAVDGTFGRLGFLAQHHLERCIGQWHLLELMIALYRRRPAVDDRVYSLNKAYVAVFDGVFRDGVARGELRDDVPLRAARDGFYGSLEYTARTLLLRRRSDRAVAGAAAQVLALFRQGVERAPAAATGGGDIEAVTRRLEKVAARLEARGRRDAG